MTNRFAYRQYFNSFTHNTMMKKYLIRFSLLTAVVLGLWGCSRLDDFTNASLEFDGEYASAILNSHIEIGDIVGELDSSTTIELDDDGLIHLIYRGDFTQRSSDDVFASIPQIPLPVLDTFYPFPYTAPNGMILDYVLLKTANILVNAQTTMTEDIDLMIELPEVLHPETGETYKYFTTMEYEGEATTSALFGMNIAGWELHPDAGAINIRYVATDQSGNRIFLDNLYFLFQNFTASYLQGYFGQEVYDLPHDTIIIDFFDRWISGGVEFADPIINLTVENAFGFPVRTESNFMNIWTVDGDILPLQSDFLDNGIDFNYPSLTEVGESKFTYFNFNKDNSNIEDLFSVKPIAVDYDIDALANPDGDPSLIGWATDSSFFTIEVFVDLPVYGNTNFFTVRQDAELDFNEDLEFADYAVLKIVTENNIPMDIGMQLYFEAADSTVLDSLFDTPIANILPEHTIVRAAGTDSDGVSNSTSFNEIEIEIPRDKFEAFKNSANLAFFLVMNNEGGEFVKLFDKDDLQMNVGMRLGISQE